VCRGEGGVWGVGVPHPSSRRLRAYIRRVLCSPLFPSVQIGFCMLVSDLMVVR
jgi:hypothetical protein